MGFCGRVRSSVRRRFVYSARRKSLPANARDADADAFCQPTVSTVSRVKRRDKNQLDEPEKPKRSSQRSRLERQSAERISPSERLPCQRQNQGTISALDFRGESRPENSR